MNDVITVLWLLLSVAMTGVIGHLLARRIPLSLIQVAAGALLSAVFGARVHLEPSTFFLLFVPPLLFADGWRIPRREFVHWIGDILSLAVGLVAVTILATGYLIHALIPGVPLAACFALAAVLSPTDAVSTSTMLHGLSVPSRLRHVLAGEALLNDATGLVAFQFAVVAIVDGVFHMRDIAEAFIWESAGGLVVGWLVAYTFALLRRLLLWRTGAIYPAGAVAMLFLIPFASFLIAEHLHVSGILSVVSAGMTMSYLGVLRHGSVTLRMTVDIVWSTTEFILNGIVFLILGMQLPALIEALAHGGPANEALAAPQLIGDVLAISAFLLLVRALWIGLAMRGMISKQMEKNVQARSIRLLLFTSFAGTRGALTLAAILSLPLTLAGGKAFPFRDALIFFAAGCIIVSMLVASIFIPIVLRGSRDESMDATGDEERTARITSLRAASVAVVDELNSVRKLAPPETHEAIQAIGSRIAEAISLSLLILDAEENAEHKKVFGHAERRLRLSAVAAQRGRLIELHDADLINGETLRKLLRELDFIEASISGLTLE